MSDTFDSVEYAKSLGYSEEELRGVPEGWSATDAATRLPWPNCRKVKPCSTSAPVVVWMRSWPHNESGQQVE